MSHNYHAMPDQQQAALYQAQNPYLQPGAGQPQPQQPVYGSQAGYAPQQQGQYGQPGAYGAPYQQQPVYGAPQQQYGAPQQQYGAPQQQYHPPQQQPQVVVYTQPPVAYAPAPVHPHHGYDASKGVHAPLSPGNMPSDGMHHQPVSQGERFDESANRCRDSIWAVLFVMHVIGICILAGVFLKKYGKDLANNPKDDEYDPYSNRSRSDEIKVDAKAAKILAACAGVGLALAFLWLHLFKLYARALIWACLIASPVLQVVLGCLFLGPLNVPVAGGMILLFAALNLLFIYLVRHRINFSANILTIVVQVLQLYPATTLVSFGVAAGQVAWTGIWFVAAAGAMHSFRNQEEPPHYNPDGSYSSGKSSDAAIGATWFFMLVSFYWTVQVLKNICHVTTAGVVASWYFLAPNMPASPTLGALKRASWTSLGSICLGSLLLAVIRAMRTMVQMGRNAEHPVARCIVHCLLSMLERMVEYFNIYAFTQIAIYGKPYCKAASDTWTLLKSSGVSALVNDDLVGSVLFFASLMSGLVGAGLAAFLAKSVLTQPLWGLWALLGGLLSMGVCVVAMEVVSSAVTAFFVCWAEDPLALQASKPHVYEAMTGAIGSYKIKIDARAQAQGANRR